VTSPATWLFVPGDRADRFDKAVASGPEEVIIDLEDAVGPHAKRQAGEAVASWLRAGSAWVRINAVATPWHGDDLSTLAGAPGLRGIMVPKAEDASVLEEVHARAGVPVIALIESGRGIDRAESIASATGVSRLAFGSVDFALDIGAAETRDSLLLARSRLVIASRLAGLTAPIEGITGKIDDPHQVYDDARYARDLGFGAKLCIHPRQLEPAARAFTPLAEEIEWARTIVGASTAPGAVQVGGEMVDLPVLERARRLLRSIGEPPAEGRGTDA
jgi:citrate lyase subunit beta/citryl-CoA lyase